MTTKTNWNELLEAVKNKYGLDLYDALKGHIDRGDYGRVITILEGLDIIDDIYRLKFTNDNFKISIAKSRYYLEAIREILLSYIEADTKRPLYRRLLEVEGKLQEVVEILSKV